jgi:hypothetical protein
MSHAINFMIKVYALTSVSVVHLGPNSGQEVAEQKKRQSSRDWLFKALRGGFKDLMKKPTNSILSLKNN